MHELSKGSPSFKRQVVVGQSRVKNHFRPPKLKLHRLSILVCCIIVSSALLLLPMNSVWFTGAARIGNNLEASPTRTKAATFAYRDAKGTSSGQNEGSTDQLVQKALLAHPSERNKALVGHLRLSKAEYQLTYPERLDQTAGKREASGKVHQNRTSLVIKAFQYNFRLELELNNNLFGPGLIQKHFLQKGGQQISTQKLEHCYYHARGQAGGKLPAVGAFRTCGGLSGIIHVNNESLVIQPFYDADLSKKHPHIIYRYQPARLRNSELPENGADSSDTPTTGNNRRECGNSNLHEWALRQYSRLASRCVDCDTNEEKPIGKSFVPILSGNSMEKLRRFNKRDVGLVEKYIELALILSQDMFEKRNSSSRAEVVHDSIQIVNCLDLYFRSANTRVSLIYIETWPFGDQIELSQSAKQTLYNLLEYSKRKLYKVSMDALHLLTGGSARPFDSAEVGMSIPDSICSSRAVSVSQEASQFEHFVTAATMAHMLGHNLGMEHDIALETANATPTRSPQTVSTSSVDNSSPTVHPARGNQYVASRGHQGAWTGNDNEEHEDEIKSRSLALEHETSEIHQSPAEHCRAGCLMSERFTYLQSPLTIGRMETDNQSGFSLAPEEGTSPLSTPSVEQDAQTRLPFRFSRQSLETYHKLLRHGHGICLFNKPNQLEDFRTCGNGIVDRGEDCDCGSFQECLETDSCCDPITCRFKADAECISGACCDRCKLRPSGFVCRRARSECDLAEMCDGKSGQCSPDVHKHNGYPCSLGTGFCYLGTCPKHDSQCAELWGSEARKSDRSCYAGLNTNGTIRGNCGFEPTTRRYKRCDSDSVLCGTLQCQLGDMKPVTAALEAPGNVAPSQHGATLLDSARRLHEFSKKVIHSSDGSHHECKAITALANPNGQVSSLSYVLDGTKCGNQRVCSNQSCQQIEQLYRDAFELCPRDESGRQCSGNGICSTANRCHCEASWTGHDCSQRPPVETLPPPAVEFSTRVALPELVSTSTAVYSQTLQSQKVLDQTTAAIRSVTAATISPGELLTVTEPVLPASTTTTTPASALVGSPSTVVVDKKKHDALGAPTLVFILVSIVAAVYVGFALMANCYRRKGFIKPDKVLRHHQMNVKLDALRTSMLAKRLAEAEAAAAAASLENGSQPSCGQPLGAPNGLDILSPFSAPSSIQQHHLSAVYSNCQQNLGGFALDNKGVMSASLHPSLGQQQPAEHSLAQGQQFGMHYFDEQPQRRIYVSQRSDKQQQSYEDGDHVPLLIPTSCEQISYGDHQANRRSMAMRSFNGPQLIHDNHQVMEPTRARNQWSSQTNTMRAQQQAITGSRGYHQVNPMSRTISLGSVGRQHEQQGELHKEPHQSDCVPGRASTSHRALVTPVRLHTAVNTTSIYGNRAQIEDSCSAPSSPEHRDSYWSDAEQQQQNHTKDNYTLSRQSSRTKLALGTANRQQSGYHEEMILNSISNHIPSRKDRRQQLVHQHSGKKEEEMLPPLPPPPPPLPMDSSRECSEDESDPVTTVSQLQIRSNKRQSEPLIRSPISSGWSKRQIPLNNGEPTKLERSVAQREQLSLIAQLEQLERVQSLHQKQVANERGTPTSGDGSHEFFSLPLSVQLSALLTRSLRDNNDFSTTPIDDYLNTLNNSSVAASSRRSFRNATSQPSTVSREQQQRVGTMKKQQKRMHNLQDLINKLQKLQSKTMLQQQLNELNGDLDDESEIDGVHSMATSIRRSASRSRSPRGAPKQSADDLVTVSQRRTTRCDLRGSWNNNGHMRRPTRSREELNGNMNESVYSMSDSEDGGYVTRVLVSYQDKFEAKLPPAEDEIESKVVIKPDKGKESTEGTKESYSTSPDQALAITNPEEETKIGTEDSTIESKIEEKSCK